MRKNFKIMLIGVLALFLVVSTAAYVLLTPQYKTIELNGYQMEVPESSNNVTKVNDNYITYDDKEHNITIKSYAINNLNETNYTGAGDVGSQIGSNIGNNTTIENKTVLNQSEKYTYYDFSNYQMIVITADNYDTISHILKTLNKTDIYPNAENMTIDLMTISNNTTESNNTTTEINSNTKKTQSTTSTKKQSSQKTPQRGDYIGEGGRNDYDYVSEEYVSNGHRYRDIHWYDGSVEKVQQD